jgi:hypothetical protein
MQDTSTQAMTEVALALSMAFFSLLIVALISIGLPANNDSVAFIKEVTATQQIQASDINMTEVQTDSESNDQANTEPNAKPNNNATVHAQSNFLFFYKDQLYMMKGGANSKANDIDSLVLFDKHYLVGGDLIIVLPEQTSVSQLRHLQEQFRDKQMQFAVMSGEWLNTLKTKFG